MTTNTGLMSSGAVPLSGGGSYLGADAAVDHWLKALHPWVWRMSRKPYWPTFRAVFGGMAEPLVKAAFLVKGVYEDENPKKFEMRVQMTEPLLSGESISERLIGSVFRDEIHVDWPEEGDLVSAAYRPLAEWTEDVDRQGRTLEQLIEDNAPEAMNIGICGFLIDRPEVEGDFSNREQARAAGALALSAKRYRAEEIADWDVDDEGRLLWIKLRRVVTRIENVQAGRFAFVEFLYLDREGFQRYEAPLPVKYTRGAYLIEQVPLSDIDPDEIREVARGVHGAGIVPFVPYYGIKRAPMRGLSPLEGTARADIATLNADSIATFAEWIHGHPEFWVKTGREIKQIEKNLGVAWKLDPQEDEEIGYAETDAAGLDHLRQVVEDRRLSAYRAAGADPSGLFDTGSTPESGRAKQQRFATTEERVLARFASSSQEAHQQILEVAFRLLTPGPHSADETICEAVVRYPKDFDLADEDTLIAQYAESKTWIPSERYHREMTKRLAARMLGDVATKTKAEVSEQIEAAPEGFWDRSPVAAEPPADPFADENTV